MSCQGSPSTAQTLSRVQYTRCVSLSSLLTPLEASLSTLDLTLIVFDLAIVIGRLVYLALAIGGF